MRVLFWPETFLPTIGGGEVLAAMLIPALQARGHELLVVTRKDSDDLPDESEHAGVPLHRFPFWRLLHSRQLDELLAARRRLANLLRAFRPDLVHRYALGPGAAFQQQPAAPHRAPLLVSLHETPADAFVRPGTVLGSTLRSADWVAACSGAVLDEVRRQVPELTPRSSVTLNGLAAPALRPAALPFEAPRLLCLGRVVAAKGFDLALTAFAGLMGRFPGARLVVAGDGIARAELQAQAAELGIAAAVDFLGWVTPDDVPGLINRCTLVIVPSRWEEPFGLVALQAAQLARPVVAARVGGLPEVVVHGQTGLLVDKEDSAALAAAVASLLERPRLARRLGRAAARRAAELFGWERYVDAYDGLYRDLAAQSVEAARG